MAGRTVLRLANAEILPLEFTRLAATLEGYLNEVMDLAGKMRRGTEALNRWIREGYLEAASDPTPDLRPTRASGRRSLLQLRAASKRRGGTSDQRPQVRSRPRPFRIGGLASGTGTATVESNPAGAGAEVRTTRRGCRGAPRYRHHIYAPGFYTGYGVKTLPGVREAIEQRDWEQVEVQIERTAGLIRAFSGEVERAARLLAP